MKFSENLINWYDNNKRDLPWRRTKNPYKIWVSEIILQQTRVNQGWDYYLQFLEKFPTIEILAQASEQEVLKQWQGLGYYSRARNMHKTAKRVVLDFKGIFPDDYNTMLSLSGIGDYTAAAISSISFNKPYPVIDGNVLRVVSRIFGIYDPVDSQQGKEIIKNRLNELIDKGNPSDFNQGIMELGALICKPKSPDCWNCVFNDSCIAHNDNEIDKLPVKVKKVKITRRYFHYLVIQFGEKEALTIILKERIENDIWKGLNDFPLFEFSKKMTQSSILKKVAEDLKEFEFSFIGKSKEYKHILSHQTIYTRFYFIRLRGNDKALGKWLLTNNFYISKLSELDLIPFPKLIENFIKKEL